MFLTSQISALANFLVFNLLVSERAVSIKNSQRDAICCRMKLGTARQRERERARELFPLRFSACPLQAHSGNTHSSPLGPLRTFCLGAHQGQGW